MSLRDFNSNDDRPIALQTEPLGNGTGLDSFHTVHPEEGSSNTPKIVGALAVALMIGAAGVAIYAHSTSTMQAKPMVTASNLPAPASAPAAAPAPQAAMTPDANMPASTEAAPAPVKTASTPVPVKSASTARSHVAGSGAASARMAADTSRSSVQPQQQAAVIPEPVSPTPSPSDVAANNPQSSAAVPQNNTIAPQQVQSSTPQASNAAPAQDQQTGATPAPVQPAGQ